MKERLLSSLAPLAAPLRGLRVLLYGFSGRGFPGGDGAIEAASILPELGISAEYTHERDPRIGEKLAGDYDLAIICNTRIGRLLEAPERLWSCAARRVLWFWDLRPGRIGAPLRGRVNHVFLSFCGDWTSPEGELYSPGNWSALLGCPVGYAPQASPLRAPIRDWPDPARVMFIGDLANRTYHQGRRELCLALGARVHNAKAREDRLTIEARMPGLYGSARYCLSTSPAAPGYTSVRTYSILACGGLLLLQRFPACERLFADGENAVIFDAADDAWQRLVELDDDPAARERIAASGRELHAANHTVAHRVLAICREALL
jgi:Glycosyl transferases group 1